MPRVLTALAVVLLVAAGVTAEEKPTDAFKKAMQDTANAMRTIRAAAKEIEDSGSGAQDYMPFETATATLQASFATTLAFWESRKTDDAVKLTQDAARFAADLEKAARDTEYRLVLDAIAGLDKTCASCHAAHRVRLDDGTYEIK